MLGLYWDNGKCNGNYYLYSGYGNRILYIHTEICLYMGGRLFGMKKDCTLLRSGLGFRGFGVQGSVTVRFMGFFDCGIVAYTVLSSEKGVGV